MEKVTGLKAGYSWQMAHNISLFLLWLHLLSNSTRKGPTLEWLYMFGFFLWMSCELKQRCLSWARGWIKWPVEFPSEFSYSSVTAMLSVLLMSPANSWSDIKWLCSWPRQTCARGSFQVFSLSFYAIHHPSAFGDWQRRNQLGKDEKLLRRAKQDKHTAQQLHFPSL